MIVPRLVAAVAVTVAATIPSPAAFAHDRGGHGGDRGGHQRERAVAAPPRVIAGPRIVERRSIAPRVVPPVVIGPRGYSSPVYAPRVYSPRVVRPVIVSPRVVVAPRVVRPYGYSRPYYTFRPRAPLGFGVWIGYPVVYPTYAYPVPVPYPAPYPVYAPPYPPATYGYPAGGYPPAYSQPGAAVTAAPAANVGGLSFEFSPSDAAVYVDGQYVGTVAQFTSTSQPLSLNPGRHHVEIQAQGYVPLAFDADIVAGEVIPYQGSLRPY